MRYLIYILSFLAIGFPCELKADDASYKSFVESRDVIATIYFPANTAALHRSEHDQISRVMTSLRELQANGHLIRVEGYSSPEGSDETNMHLSMYRARTIAEIIAAKGCESEIALTGYGDLRAQFDDPAKERRVEIASYVKPPVLKKVRVADEVQQPLPVPLPMPQRRPIAKEIKLPLPMPQPSTVSREPLPELRRGPVAKEPLPEPKGGPVAKEPAPEPGRSPVAKELESPVLEPRMAVDEPVIDALDVEQAIMEKIGAVSSPSEDALSRLDQDYVNR